MDKSEYNWSTLPSKWDYLIDAALKYGIESDVARVQFVQNIGDGALKELESIAASIQLYNHQEELLEWCKAHPLTDSPESARIYFLLLTLDYLDLLT